MNQTQKCLLNFGLSILSLAYYFYGKEGFALYLSIIALFLAIESHPWGLLLEHFALYTTIMFVQLFVINISHLNEQFPLLGIYICMHTFVFLQYSADLFEDVSLPYQITNIACVLFFLVAMILPIDFFRALFTNVHSTLADLFALIIVIFMPGLVGYVHCILLDKSYLEKTKKHTIFLTID